MKLDSCLTIEISRRKLDVPLQTLLFQSLFEISYVDNV